MPRVKLLLADPSKYKKVFSVKKTEEKRKKIKPDIFFVKRWKTVFIAT
jgi:hypothetical protein